MIARETAQLLRLITGPFLVVDGACEVVFANQSFCELLKWEKGRLIGRSFMELVAEPREKTRQTLKLFFGSGEWLVGRLSLHKGDGSRLEFPCKGCVMQRPSPGQQLLVIIQFDEPIQFQALVQKVEELNTEIRRRRLVEEQLRERSVKLEQEEDALRESEHFLSCVIDHIPNLLFVKDANDLCFVRFNKAGEALLGYTREELLGKNDYDFFPKAQADFFVAKDRAILDSAEPLDIPEEPISTRLLGLRYLHTKKIPIFAGDGSPRYLLGISEDITERKREKDALRENEEKLRSLYELSPLGIALTDMNGRYVEFNESFRRICGYSEEELKTLDYWTLTPRKYEADEARHLESLAGTGRYGPYEKEYVRKDGSLIPLRFNGILVTGRDGRMYIWSIVEDITESKRAEMELRAASLYSRSLIEASIDPLVTISPEGKITDVNLATEAITGRKRSELIDTDFADNFTEPDKARAGYRQVFARGFVRDFPLTLRHISGKETEVNYNASVYLNEEGEVAGVFAAARDITEHKRAEAARTQLAAIVEFSNDAIIGKTPDGIITSWNKGAERIYGYSADEVLGKSITLLGPERHAEIHGLLETIRKGGTVVNHETERVCKGGALIHVALTLSPIRDASGNISGISTIARDITERRQAETELRALKNELEQRVVERTRQLEAANKELEAFAYSVSHDLRTPLRAIDGFSRILLDEYPGKLDKEGRRLLNVVRDNTCRMGQLIDDMLKFSRTGRVELTLSLIDMERLAHEVFEELRPAGAGDRLQLEIEAIPPAMGDSAMMRQVFVNLLSNAIKFSHSRDIARIKVGGSIAGSEAVYYVMDNGVGFDNQYVDKLFGVFQRLHSVNEFEGTGIGLAIVKRIITRHGGRVWAEGEVGRGATVHFTLPVRVCAD
ncbi:PAS domain S-box protein [Candidatus Methylospira mobilis]|nr:PAS domain S-box protein [Candidatus Methylospira mobilis]WNV03271.1 PAS domain S-box protein [Candidatus Methylospira mobilis]